MVYSGAAILAEHVDLGRRLVVVRVGGEDDVPGIVEVVEFGCPEVGRVVGPFCGLEEETAFGSIPVAT